ncbi:MAG: TetR/AcrR family transcriptional repressor of nem operon [Gammaproteobacteria bacterium]|jgi:TetR/AcrR family transcriptional repressor of nem operon
MNHPFSNFGLTYIPVGIINTNRSVWLLILDNLKDVEVYWWRPLSDDIPDTRTKILNAAYREIHANGFQAASLSHILARAGVTKGALYHHFPNKTELGYAVIDEVIAARIRLSFIAPIEQFDDPIEGFIEMIRMTGETFSMTDIELGCPLTSLAQEMAPIDEGFRVRLINIYEQWYEAIAGVLRKAQENQLIIDGIDPYSLAITMAATLEGCLNAAKVGQSLDKLHHCGLGLTRYLQLLRIQDNQDE